MRLFSGLFKAAACLALFLTLSSCSDTDYLSAVPGDATALVSLTTPKMFVDYKGLDVGAKVLLFESGDGNLGLCAKVNDADKLEEALNGLAAKGLCERVTEKRGCRFSLLRNGFLAGFSDEALLLMGPVTPDASAVLLNRMAKLLKQDESRSALGGRLFATLDSIDGPMAMAAQVKALPEQLAMPFSLGAPKEADASQLYVAARMEVKSGVLYVDGHTYSYNKTVDQSLRESARTFRSINGRYAASMPQDAAAGMFLNVDGTKFLPIMRANPGLQALLAGVNRAIDLDNIIQSVNGDMAIVMTAADTTRLQLSMAAELAHSNWLSDVDYWKRSCPAGSTITDWTTNSFAYRGGGTSFWFGVTGDKQFYSGGDAPSALASIKRAERPLPQSVVGAIKGQRLVLVVNLGALTGKQAAVAQLLKPLFGNVGMMVYRMEAAE